jgi:hypothetical protein
MNPRRPALFSAFFSLLPLSPLVLVGLLVVATAAQAQQGLIRLSTDPFTNSESQHATEVEPDTFAFGSTFVTAFQVGRISGGGSSDIGFATSTNGGATLASGFLPGITQFYKGGQFLAASDPSVSYDAAHGKWLIASLGLGSSNNYVLTSSSSDGITWNNPVTVNSDSFYADKEWIACDNTPSSAFYGHCYIEWEDAANGAQVEMSTSADGGQTWSAAYNVPNAFGLGGQPVVQPNGTAVVPFLSFTTGGIQVYTSTDGGRTWGNLGTLSDISDHLIGGNLRAVYVLPSVEVDGAGKIYAVWWDCRFRNNCSSNDLVLSTSTDGTHWSAPSRIPIDPVSSTVDHFLPGLAVDPATSGSTAHLALTFYFYPVANCNQSTCKLGVGVISSHDGGKTWAQGKILGQGMNLNWLPSTSLGQMVGDYISTSFVNGKAYGVFAGAQPLSGGKFREAMYTPKIGMLEEGTGPLLTSAGDKPVPNAKSDHGPREFWDSEGKIPRRPSK